MMQKKQTQNPDRRINTEIEDAVRESAAENEGEYSDVLNTLSRRGVPRAVIERIFLHRQSRRSTDNRGEK